MGLVGESGCGKTTIGRLLTRVIKADSGTVLFEGRDILSMHEGKFSDIQKDIQMVFQDPQPEDDHKGKHQGTIYRSPDS